MLPSQGDMFAHTREKLYNSCSASFPGKTGTLRSPAFLTGSTPQQILLSLRPLLIQQLIQPAGTGHYQIHAVVAKYVQTHFVEGDQQAKQQALRAAHARAARYYLEQAQATALPHEQRRGVTDIQGIIEAVWQYTQAAQWQDAYALMEQEDLLSDLSLWGANILLLDLCEWFLPRSEWQPESEQAISIYLYLGGASWTPGNSQQALEYYQQALALSREVGDRRGEGSSLNNIGSVYDVLDDKQQALEYYQQALAIRREIGDREGEGTTLNNIGGVYSNLGNSQQALEYYQQALALSREVGDRGGEGTTLNNIGAPALDQHHYNFALAALLIARQCFKEVSSPQQNKVEDWINHLRQAIGQKQFAALQEDVEPRLQQIVEQGLGAKSARPEEEDTQHTHQLHHRSLERRSLMGAIRKILLPKNRGK